MLSSENPPPDLPCSSRISPLETITACCDERNPLPSFSIRDYVSSERGKDIENNWPFSQKNLQRCLKYGVKDVLPPFDEALNSATTRTPPAVKCGAEILSCSNGKDRNLAPTVKKCRLSVKLNSASEQTTKQDLVSEKMAASVCPVCKTFSSSSNTTLNAHIDQCLSGESTAKWTASATTSSKVIKHRVKPRKTRLMVDIYRTALDCTLEDLDRRNGTNWASNLECPGEDPKACSTVNVNENINEGGDYVYIDSNGTKVRVLSKLGDLPLGSDGGYDCGPSKVMGTDEGNNILLTKKKKNLGRKQKLLNHCLYEQKKSHPGPKVNDEQQNKHKVYVGDCDQMTSDINSGRTRQWIGSKRTGLREDISHGRESQHLDKHKTKSRIKSNMSSDSSLGDKLVIKRLSATKSDKSPLLVTESRKRNRLRKKSLSKAQDCHDRNDSLYLISNIEGSRNDSPSVDHEHHVDPFNGVENHVSALEKDGSLSRSFMPSQHHTFSPEGKKFKSPGKRLLGRAIPSVCKNFASLRNKLSIRHASISESKKKMRRKHLDLKKRRLRCISGSEEEAVEALRENKAQMEHATSKSWIINKAGNLETQKKRGGFVNAGKRGDVTLKSQDPSPESDSHGGVGKNVDSFTKGSFPADAYNVEIRDGFVCEPSYEVSDGEAFAAFSRSLNSAYPGSAGTNVGECFAPHYNEAYVGHCNNELLVSGEHVLPTHSSLDVAEMDAGDAQRNYYVDVDAIPIPGPPGSFLPSPGRMGSEELQGISSLTTCRIQSSEDEREVVDMGSLDSPISVMSVVSNSFAPISMQSHFRKTLPENNPTPEPEKNARNSSMGYGPSLVVSSNSDGRFTSHSDCDSPTKSTSNPVLRLMGKNLMVMNKDENPSPQSRLSTQCGMATIENQGPLFGVDNGVSAGNIHNEPQYSPPTLSWRPPSLPENMHDDMPAQYFDNCNLSDGFQVPSNFRPPQFPSKIFGGRFSSPLESREYANVRNLIGKPLGSNIRRLDIRNAAYDDNIEKVRNCIPHLNSVDSLGSREKEIVVINDSPKRHEGGLTVEATHGGRVINNPFYGYDQTRGYPICASGSRDIQYRNTQMPVSKGANANLSTWINCPAECSKPNSLTSASILPPTVAYLKPSLYFPHHGYS